MKIEQPPGPGQPLRAGSTLLTLEPYVAVARMRQVFDASLYRSETIDPQFIAHGELPRSDDGLYLFELDVASVTGSGGAPMLYFDFGEGFTAEHAVSMAKATLSGKPYSIVVALDERPRSIRLDPCSAPGQFLCSDLYVTAIAPARAALLGPPAARFPVGRGKSVVVPGDAVQGRLRVGAVLHLFYADLWPEMAEYLHRIPSLDRLYVSVGEGVPPQVVDRIRTEFPGALVRRVPNRGRDFLPFLHWLRLAAAEGVDVICKLHTKRPPFVATGDAWRHDMLDKVLGSKADSAAILARFRTEPGLGIVAPGGHVVPSTFSWERNVHRVHQLSEALGSDLGRKTYQFVPGSIFWARVAALLPLAGLPVDEEDFEEESGAEDGTLAHALERCVPIAAAVAGYGLAETPNTTGASVLDFAPTPSQHSYARWLDAYEPKPEQYARLAQAHGTWKDAPLISLVMPAYNPRREDLVRALESVLAQVYGRWELCVADDASTEPHVREVLEAYRHRDPRIKVAYRERNGHISAASNTALALATGEYIGLIDHDDELHPLALHYVAEAIVRHGGCELVFTDEDKIGPFGRYDPYFKCELNYELLLAHNMVSHFGCYRARRLRDIGGFREGFEGSQDYDLALRFIEGLEPARIVHVPRVLYHWRASPGSMAGTGEEKPYALVAAQRAIAEHLERVGTPGEVLSTPEAPGMNRVRFRIPDPAPEVCIIIPTRDRADLLGMCVDSVLSRTAYPSYSILIVDNGSREKATATLLARLQSEPRISVLRDDGEFNFSALNNRAVRQSSAEFVCLLNNDIEVPAADWLEEMVGMAARPGIGAVGARLWYPDKTLQHGGVILGLRGVASHAHKHLHKGQPGYFGRAVLHQAMSAVTAACLLVRRGIYEEVGGLDETFRIAFNDIDFCLRVRAAGYRNVWTPFAELVHHESATRGYETTPEKRVRFEDEVRRMRERWGELLLNDPAYSPNLTLETEDFTLAWPPRVEPAGAH